LAERLAQACTDISVDDTEGLELTNVLKQVMKAYRGTKPVKNHLF